MRKVIIAVILALVLGISCPALAQQAPMELTTEERYAVNLFLSNFTELGMNMDRIENHGPDRDLVDFAHDHIWFNCGDSYEYGEYSGDNNCRVSDSGIQAVIDSFFHDVPEVDLSQTRFDYDGEYYYHCETGGWAPAGFACVTGMWPAKEKDVYYVSFLVFADGLSWENDILGDDAQMQLFRYFAADGMGCATVYAPNPADRSSYRMISYSRL